MESNPCITYQEKLVIYSIIEKSVILKKLFEIKGINSCNKISQYGALASFFNDNIDELYHYANVNSVSVNSNDKIREITLMDGDVKSLSLFFNKQLLHINKKNFSSIVKSYTIYTDSMLFMNKDN